MRCEVKLDGRNTFNRKIRSRQFVVFGCFVTVCRLPFVVSILLVSIFIVLSQFVRFGYLHD